MNTTVGEQQVPRGSYSLTAVEMLQLKPIHYLLSRLTPVLWRTELVPFYTGSRAGCLSLFLFSLSHLHFRRQQLPSSVANEGSGLCLGRISRTSKHLRVLGGWARIRVSERGMHKPEC